MIYMVHFGPLPPIWDLLDKRSDEALQLLSLEEFTDIVNGCAPNALLRNSFAILRIVSMARYLQHKTQEIYAVPKAWLSARVQSLPPRTTLSGLVPMLRGTSTASKPLWTSTVRMWSPQPRARRVPPRDIPGWNDQGRWIESKAYKTMDAQNSALGHGDKHPVLMRFIQVRLQVRSRRQV